MQRKEWSMELPEGLSEALHLQVSEFFAPATEGH